MYCKLSSLTRYVILLGHVFFSDDDLYMYSKSQTGNEIISILELCDISKDLPRILRPFSNWEPSKGLMKITNQSKWIRRQDLNVELF